MSYENENKPHIFGPDTKGMDVLVIEIELGPSLTIIDQSRVFAIEAHGNQKRKYTGEPYWHHLRDVAERVALLTDDEDVIAAAWLHDVIEDTSQSFGDVSLAFGKRVATMVAALTDIYTHAEFPDQNRAWRKTWEAKRLGCMHPYVRLIKLCDVQSNASSIEAEGGQFAEVWKAEKKVLVAALLGGE